MKSHYVGDSNINLDHVEFVIETKKLNSKESGIPQAEDAFLAFNDLKMTYATNFGDRLYRRERNSPQRTIKLKDSKVEDRITTIAKIISRDVKIITRKIACARRLLTQAFLISISRL